MKPYVLAPPVRAFATDRGLLFVGAASGHQADSVQRRVDLGSRQFERQLLRCLRGEQAISTLNKAYTAASVARALESLRAIGVIVESEPTQVVDLTGWLALKVDDSEKERKIHDSEKERKAEDSEKQRRVFVADLADEGLADHLRQHRTVKSEVLIVVVGQRSICAIKDDRQQKPCAHCALLFHAEAHTLAWRADIGAAMKKASAEGHDGDGSAALKRAALQAFVLSYLEQGAAWPEVGAAHVFSLNTWSRSVASYGPHPACDICGKTDAKVVPATIADPSLPSFFAPLPALSVGEASVAAVRFRRSLKAWPLRRDDFGVASGAGPRAELLAFAEGVERFGMLHAPPDVRSVSADDLGRDVMAQDKIAQLLFREQERAQIDFPFPAYAADLKLDWSWSTSMVSGQRLLVPTSLIGRAPPRSLRLAGASSNGYAAHVSQEAAEQGALLEVVERDAILSAWYLQRTLPRFELPTDLGLEVPAGTRVAAFLATWTIDLPVVWLLALSAEGVARSSGAAGITFQHALRAAALEMKKGLQADASAPQRPQRAGVISLDSMSAQPGPLDHRDHYAQAAHGGPIERWLASPVTVTSESLVARWPERDHARDFLCQQLTAARLEAFIVDRSSPELFGEQWKVVRALVPGALELSWGRCFVRLASSRVAGATICSDPHPIA